MHTHKNLPQSAAIPESGSSPAEGSDHWTWYESDSLPLEGKAFKEACSPFGRIPADMTDRVSAAVRDLGRHACGMSLRFTTDSDAFRLVAGTANWPGWTSDLYLTAFAQRGWDWYFWNEAKQSWVYVNHAWNKPDGTIDVTVEVKPGTPVLVNFPFRGEVDLLKLGVRKGCTVKRGARHAFAEKPIVHYGTSIVHGGCVSRPGLVFPSVVGRRLDADMINLGFSGSALCEPVMSEMLAHIDAALYIVDPVWNMPPDLQALEPFVRGLRAKRPETPILLCEEVSTEDYDTVKSRNVRALYQKLCDEGWKDLHLFKSSEMLPLDPELTLDRCHPNDAGALRMADAYTARIRQIFSQGRSPTARSPARGL
jgi:hypothetical protein